MSALLASPQAELRRVLLVEADRPLARVIARALSPRYLVTTQPSAEGALHLLERGLDVHVVLSAYRLSHGTTARWLFSAVRRRWPRMRLVLYAEEELRSTARAHADAVVHVPGDFAELRRALE